MNATTSTFVAIAKRSGESGHRFDLAFRKGLAGFERDHGLSGVETCGLLQVAPTGSCWEIVVETRPCAAREISVRSSCLEQSARIEVNGPARLSRSLETFIEDAKTSHAEETSRRRSGPPRRRRPVRSDRAAIVKREPTFVMPTVRRERVIVSARRLICALQTESDTSGEAMLSEGIEVPFGGAPDWLILGERATPCEDWPCVDGRLFAPAEPVRRVIAIHDLEGRRPLCRTDKIAIYSGFTWTNPVEWKDWRTDDEILAAATETLRLGTVEPSDAEAIADALAHLNSGGPAQDFLVGRLIEVARRRSDLPRSFVDALLRATGADIVIDRESAARMEKLELRLARIETEAEEKLAVVLSARRREVTQAEERIVHLQAFELEAHRKVDDMRRGLYEAIDDRVSTALSMRLAELDSTSLRVAATAQEAPDADLLYKLEQDFSTLRKEVHALAEQVARDLPQQRPSDTEGTVSVNSKTEAEAISTTAGRIEATDYCARRYGTAELEVALGATVATGGRMPIFVGTGARLTALAVAEAIAGGDAGIVHCGPTLLSVDDLLDPRRARTSIVLDTIQNARDAPWRWHAVAFIDLDWAPAGYWLHAFSVEARASLHLPANVALVASTATDGDRVPLPMSTLLSTIPLASTAKPKVGRTDLRRLGPWSTAIEPSESGEFRAGFTRRAATTFDVDPAIFAELVDIASSVHELCRWNPDDAVAALRPVSSWLRAQPPYHFDDPALKSLIDSLIRNEGH